MCGIAGFTHLDRRTDPDRIRQATESLVHRGPDQQGVFETESVSLGAVRLSLSTAAGNAQAQALYESSGWRRDEQYFVYHLAIER